MRFKRSSRYFPLLVLAVASVPEVAGASYVSTAQAQGPVSLYQFAETSGTTATDSGSAGINGTYTGNYTLGQAGIPGGDATDNAVSLNTNGTYTGYVGVANYTPITAYPFTVEAFIKTTSGSGNDSTPEIAGIASTSDGSSNLCIDLQSGNAGLKFRNDAAQNFLTSSVNVADGNWHQIVGVFSSATSQSLYVDGAFIKSTSISTAFPSSINTFGIGVLDRTGLADYFNGTIAEVSAYDTALTGPQITAQFQASGVPEPTTSGVLALGGLVLLSRRRRRA